MAALLWKRLVFEVERRHTGAFECPRRGLRV